jgi:hypothetical protein
MQNNSLSIESIVSVLNENPAAVGRAMVVLLARQTAGEQHGGYTVESNGRGFSAFTASSGTYYAKYVLGLSSYSSEYETRAAIVAFLASNKTGRLLNNHGGKRNFLDKARKIALTHRAQLLEVAITKRAALEALATAV